MYERGGIFGTGRLGGVAPTDHVGVFGAPEGIFVGMGAKTSPWRRRDGGVAGCGCLGNHCGCAGLGAGLGYVTGPSGLIYVPEQEVVFQLLRAGYLSPQVESYRNLPYKRQMRRLAFKKFWESFGMRGALPYFNVIMRSGRPYNDMTLAMWQALQAAPTPRKKGGGIFRGFLGALMGLSGAEAIIQKTALEVQSQLVRAGFGTSSGFADGVWGSGSQVAFSRAAAYAQRHGIPFDAIIAINTARDGVSMQPMTWVALMALPANAGAEAAPGGGSRGGEEGGDESGAVTDTGGKGGTVLVPDEGESRPSVSFFEQEAAGTPVWVWFLAGGVVLAGGGYYVYTRSQKKAIARNRRRRAHRRAA